MILNMREDLLQLYRGVLIQISENLTEEQYQELLFYCKDYVPKKFSQAPFTGVQVFDRLEDAEIISWENLSYLMEFARAIGRQDMVTQLTAFEMTRELMICASRRQGSDASLESSTASVGRHLAKMVDLVQDRVDETARVLTKSLPQSGQNVSSILDALEKSLPGVDAAKLSWCTLALLVAIAAEIVLVALDEYANKFALRLCHELANHLSCKVAKLGRWDDFCQFVSARYSAHLSGTVPAEPAPALSWQVGLTDLINKMRETFFY